MSRSPDYLYDLLPAIYRMRDSERGLPLRALLRVITEQVDVVEEDIARLYSNWFIETCDDWVVPYIGDLIGHQPVEGGAAPITRELDNRARHPILVPRREVASTLGFRGRKGTLALLEDLAAAVAGWPARAVEFYTLLGWTQHLDHQRPQRAMADLRDGDALDLIDGPFDRLAHTVDVRRIVSHRTQGRSNISNVGVFVWRRKAYPVTHASAYCVEERARHLFTFSALGNDTRLLTRPEAEPEPTHIAEEINLPTPIRRRALEERLSERPLGTRASAAYYGEGKSLSITAPGWPTKSAPQPIPLERIIPADLSDWRYRPAPGYLAVDPVLGRITFPPQRLPKQGVWVTYHYGFSADMGGGEYDRSLSQPEKHALYRVSKDRPGDATFPTIGSALAQWRADQQAAGAPAADAERERLRAAVLEIGDSAVYVEPLSIELEAGESLQIRAANRRRPIIRLLDYMTERPDAFSIAGKRASRVVIDGLVIAGRGVQISGPDPSDTDAWAEGDLYDVRIRHCTLVPGWSLHGDCQPKRPNEPSLELLGTSARISISHSIVGSIYVSASEVTADPVEIEIADSIIDATSLDGIAVGAVGLPAAFARLTVARSTVLGSVTAHAVMLVENTIFASPLLVARRQVGCVRYCYVAPGSRTPRRHRCQPDLARAAIDEQQPPVAEQERPSLKDREAARVRPVFVSTRYGNAGYCQLQLPCAEEIWRGADDEAELGAFHDLFQPQRADNLRVRLDEYTPADMEAGVVYAHEEFGR